MQATGHFVTLAAKLSAGVQHRQNNFGCALAFMRTRWIWVNRNTATVVINPATAVLEQGDTNSGAMTSHCFVDGVVNDFPNQMVKTGQTSRTDVHPGSFADRIKTFQNLDIFGAVIACSGSAFIGHVFLLGGFRRP